MANTKEITSLLEGQGYKVLEVSASDASGEIWVKCIHPSTLVAQWGLTYHEIRFIDMGKPIEAIKALRERTGMQLASSKALVDVYRQRSPLYVDDGNRGLKYIGPG